MALVRAGEAALADDGNRSARRDAELLLAHVLGVDIPKLPLFDAAVSPAQHVAFDRMIKRRLAGEPVAYILGEQAFWTLDFYVNEHTLVPRPDTETLVEVCLQYLGDATALTVADLGTGSGCILLCLLNELERASGIGLDKSPLALQVARRNAARHSLSGRVEFKESDWFSSIQDTPMFDLVVSNPPYIKSSTICALMKDVRDFEPHMALDGGTDGLSCYRQIAEQSKAYLRTGGVLAVEVGQGQAPAVASIFEQSGYQGLSIHADLNSIDRVVCGKKPQEC